MTTHTITLLPSGHQFQCSEDESILKAGLASGLFMPYSCRSGVCSTCRGTIKEGKVDFGNVHPNYLSEDDKRVGKALLCSAKPLGDCSIEVRELDPAEAFPVRKLPCRVLQLERLAPDVMLMTVGLPANEPAVFKAGQYVDFVLKDGTRRSYSIANVPVTDGVRQVELHVRLVPGGRFTEHVFNSMKLRETMQLEMPLGSFYWREQSDKPMIMLASGTGFAPIKSIIEYSIERGNKRPITLYWGGRTRACIYMAALAEKWAAEHEHITFVPVLSNATPQCNWTGRTGFVHKAVMEDFPDMSGHEVYACGAPIVVESARHDFAAQCGLPEAEFYADSFITEAERHKAAA
ncbi:CDP-6-deoxy-delta-3,4-glucoseen reductase [Noviherbaspirillum denitrificans]|uniref:CDP-6-deoxy-delta-3,4-glucoseen reductase n=1 Tax=Noviherbaspirillum denitrificans TaxID=1968433 RepID=A0A254TAF4_9BURK|nr:CDP-6-deoxy-delta-3,4-glucoseen reductase [Noviherbaspirillum denitrificans]OWW19626.1 CDP-6-deoxy-delta-3,4-glucoseen reductase [Noviherbaspirillum denitrificans]